MLPLLYARLDLVRGNSLALFHVPNLLGGGSLPFRSIMPKSNQVSEKLFALTFGEAQNFLLHFKHAHGEKVSKSDAERKKTLTLELEVSMLV
jgi:hypothetical protein